MECKRLNRMIRDWYVQVQDETLAPARMVEFMNDHAETCDTCFVDPDIKDEIAKITAIVLPPSKMTKKPKKKAAPLEPTAAALAAIEASPAPAPSAAASDEAVDDDVDDEIEVGDDEGDEAVDAVEVSDEGGEAVKAVEVSSEEKPEDPSLADADLE